MLPRARRKIAMCIGCHGIQGYQASFPEVYKVPMISGQGAKYIVAALAAYKTGDRKHPTMRGIADTLSDQDMADIAAYYEAQRQGPTRPLPAKPAKAQRPGRCPAQEGRLCLVPRRELRQAHRSGLPQDRRSARRLPVCRAQGLQDRRQQPTRPLQRRDGRHCQAVQQRRAQGTVQLRGSLEGDLKTVPEKKFR
jgi:cytochrome c553